MARGDENAADPPDGADPAGAEQPSSELISENSFQKLYQREQAGLPPAGRVAARLPHERQVPGPRELPPLAAEEDAAKPRGARRGERRRGDRRRAHRERRRGHWPPLPRAKGHAHGGEESGAPAAGEELALERTVTSWAESPASELGRELAQVRALFERAADRAEVGRVLAEQALTCARRVVLLTRRGEPWVGWTGAGDGVDEARVQQLVIPPVPGTLFGLVAQTGGHYLGRMSDHPVHRRFLRTLGFEPPETVALLPIHHRASAEIALYLDGGAGGRVSPDLGDLLVIAQQVPRVLERLARTS